MLILTCALLCACSVTPSGVSVAREAGISEVHPSFSRIEQPAGDPGSVSGWTGILTLEDQQNILRLYRDALYTALTSALTNPRLANDCVKCPILTSRILAISEDGYFPFTTELTVLFKLATPEQNGDVLWRQVITKKGSSRNIIDAARTRYAREEAITEVLRELVTVLPSDRSTRKLGTATPD
jgi:hypothetical protein